MSRFFESVREVFRQRAARYARIVEIDASRGLDHVHSDVAAAVDDFLAGDVAG